MLSEARAVVEQQVLLREYPSFRMDVEDDGTVDAHGSIGPNETLRARYHVLLVLPPSYGSGAMPQVHVLEPEIKAGAPHLYNDGTLCLDHSGAFTGKSTMVTILAWVSIWLSLYEAWVDTGVRW